MAAKSTKYLCYMIAFIVLAIVLAGCGEDTKTTDVPKDTGTADADTTTDTTDDTSQDQAASDTSDTQADTTQPQDPAAEFKALEITPSGDDRCFLSPCDCQCYPIPNVPTTAKKPTCGIDCQDAYGATGCQFTNYQCFVTE
ncbi:hypothetical protein ACFL96_08565 [Thermoproteota archaeon]